MAGLYIHIPFCTKKCHYCDFVIALSAGGAMHGRFLAALEREMEYHSPQFDRVEFTTLYLGGGTPSLLSGSEIKTLFSALARNFQFKNDAEITIEVNPGDFSDNRVGAHGCAPLRYTDLGINRVSLGAQSFHDRTLKKINRTHCAADIERSFHALRGAGIQNISLDLMLALPGETLEDVKMSLSRAVDLGPEHVSLYELVIEPKTRFGYDVRVGARHGVPLLVLPSEDEALAMLETAREFLKQSGYRHYELLSYAKPGFESRHNSLYWTGGETLGLGPGAFSYVGGTRYRLAATVDRYYAKMESGDFKPDESEILEGEKKEREQFLLALRLIEGVSVGARHGVPLREIDALVEKGLLEEKNGRVRLTARGQLFAETVFEELSSP